MTSEAGERTDFSAEAGFRSIFREFAPRLYRQAFRMLGDPDEAAEAVQEIMLKVYRSLGGFRGDSALTTWIYRIAFNTLASYGRRRTHRPVPLTEADDVLSLPDEEGDVETGYERKETSERLARCIARLSPREAAAITLFYLDGLEYKEIASIMQTSVSAVGLLLHRGREHLHVLLTAGEKGDGK